MRSTAKLATALLGLLALAQLSAVAEAQASRVLLGKSNAQLLREQELAQAAQNARGKAQQAARATVPGQRAALLREARQQQARANALRKWKQKQRKKASKQKKKGRKQAGGRKQVRGGSPLVEAFNTGGGGGGGGGGGRLAYATYHTYADAGYQVSTLYCADRFARGAPAVGAWTAYCNDGGLGPMSQDKCGRCLKVTNPVTGQSVRAVVVDMCGNGGVDMERRAFDRIDGNRGGYLAGHMNVKLEWC
ncbi:hypothetical protein D9Q98_009468 [Chlorella vulgaris]|uniref:Barwin domain-containing protein n=1 Tax=Chlorella vulgaris TaxID=3077 RepID=A0A9D4TF56_CHLVU|nr:hypothetical protein D9Q98_009468 [Chlorella vulgaris]